jgi:glycosyltransferase involved in cell wall biosynthesis
MNVVMAAAPPPADRSPPVSAMVLTLNEESNILACLASLAWCDDVVVFDSFSSDRTVELARQWGARIVSRPFDDWSSHQNWAVNNIDFRHPWVLYLDADERCDATLIAEITQIAGRNQGTAAFRIRRKDHFMGRWLRHAQLYPTWLVRLFRPECIRYERLVNPVAVVDGAVGELQGHIDHYPFSHGVAHWIARHNRYSDMEAQEAAKEGREPLHAAQLLDFDPNVRRRALKRLFFRLPARPLIKFLHYYVFRRGFLDGRAGLNYATLQCFYEFMIDCKRIELRRRHEELEL